MWQLLLLPLLCSVTVVAGQLSCPANSAGEGDGTPCICNEGYDGQIEYNDAETPPVYEGTCYPVDTDYFLGMGTGLLMSVILLAVSILAFNVASKTSFQCSMMTNVGLFLFWLLCTVFVLTAPRESDTDLVETVEVRRQWLRVTFSPTAESHILGRVTEQRATIDSPTAWRVLAQMDVMWWPRFVLSILLYAGTGVAVLAYIKDVVFFTAARKTRVVVR